jgi:hypothetical protein
MTSPDVTAQRHHDDSESPYDDSESPLVFRELYRKYISGLRTCLNLAATNNHFMKHLQRWEFFAD